MKEKIMQFIKDNPYSDLVDISINTGIMPDIVCNEVSDLIVLGKVRRVPNGIQYHYELTESNSHIERKPK